MDTVAFHLYDLRKTGYIERDEVPSLPYKIDLTMDRDLLDHHFSFSKLFPALYFNFVWVELSGEGDGCRIAVRV